MLATNCAWACDWFQPPMMPKPIRTSPFSMNAGMIVCSGRLRGASVFGCPGSSVNNPPRLCMTKPARRGTSADPNDEKLLWISETMVPSLSIAVR